MTTLNAALNYNFASAESARISAAGRGAEETIASQIRQAQANAPYQVGSTITAKYQYKVAADGSLIPQQTQITQTAPEEDAATGRGGRRSRAYQEDRRASLSDLVNPKIEMSPADEVQIFAAAEAPSAKPLDVTPTTPQAAAVQAEVLDENGETVEAELLTGNASTEAEPAQERSPILSLLAARAQTAAANLYARNSEVIYSATPLPLIAA